MSGSDRLPVGALRGPHGLQGWVKAVVKLDEPELLIEAGPVLLEDGRAVVVTDLKAVGQAMLALKIEGIDTPEAAGALRGPIYLLRANMPLSDDEILLTDLIGLPLLAPDGTEAGRITAITELPAGPALQVAVEGQKGTKVVPIEEEFVVLENDPLSVTLTDFGLQLLAL